MELFLKDGDYLPDGKGGCVRAVGGEELLQRVLFKLTARRGSFPLLPELGSRLYLLPRQKPGDWETVAREYVSEALGDESELSVSAVTVTASGSGALVDAQLEYRGETLTVTVSVQR